LSKMAKRSIWSMCHGATITNKMVKD
jgi:hypothetical protein